MSRISVDIGGTFTDVYLETKGNEVKTAKALSTPDNFSTGILNALEKISVDLGQTENFVHGTTIALNTLLERRGAITGLITTEGFRDVLEIMRTNRPEMYNLQQIKPDPLVPRLLRKEVNERLDKDGRVVRDLDEKRLLQEVRSLMDSGCTSIAICFIHSYLNPKHEQKAKEVILNKFPDLSVTISSEIIREWREFERTSTAVINAFCKPNVENYVNNLSTTMEKNGLKSPIQYMQSNGGLMSSNDFITAPVKSVLSGPIGGVTAAESISKNLNIPNLITLDIGGTSADISIVSNSEATYSQVKEINRLPILFPSVDVHTIGAGGGSKAWLDKGGNLQVGPESAGAYPGPVCYNNGGEEVSVTDANLILGYIDENYFLGGEITLNKVKAKEVAKKKLAVKLDMSVVEVAYGIIQIINAKMSRALKEISINKGYNTRELSLLSYGGAGGLHVVSLARDLGISKVIIPAHPSVFSAYGMLSADIKYDVTKTYVAALNDIIVQSFNQELSKMKQEGLHKLQNSTNQLDISANINTSYTVQMRYKGQDSTLEIPFKERFNDLTDLNILRDNFIKEHKKFYGYQLDDQIMITNVKVTVSLKNEFNKQSKSNLNTKFEESRKQREAFIPSKKTMELVSVYSRNKLGNGAKIPGPCIIEDSQSTIVIFESDTLYSDDYGNLIIELGE